MLSDPFVQLPTDDSVRVVWFSEFAGSDHRVVYGDELERISPATTTKLTRTREDKDSKTTLAYDRPTFRDIWRHEAIVSGLSPGKRVPYRAIGLRNNGDTTEEYRSRVFTLAPRPQPGTPLKILLTSDHQLKPMTAANLQKVTETIASVDAVFFAGDLTNTPDRASEWFDDIRGGAFFPCLQGRANYVLEKNGTKTVYKGGELIQNAPLFPAIGNHEVMGRFSRDRGLNEQFNDAFPLDKARSYYERSASKFNPEGDPQLQAAWLKANSFNSDTYAEIFTLPESISGGKKYYALSFGDVRLIVLYVTNVWRSFSLDSEVKGKFQERSRELNNPENWGYGQHIFESIAKGSPQYLWLEKELKSEAFEQAKYKVVMFHHPPHTLGENIVPPYTDPIPKIEFASDGTILSVTYQYPREKDYIIRDLLPLLESARVRLVYYGHSHLWNRFVSPGGMNFLESSNVGNSYGAYIGDNKRAIPIDNPAYPYAATGDANGLEAIVPNIAPLMDENDRPLPYIASNDITAFSILDTGSGKVSSYRFDTCNPKAEVIKFDEFAIDN